MKKEDIHYYYNLTTLKPVNWNLQSGICAFLYLELINIEGHAQEPPLKIFLNPKNG